MNMPCVHEGGVCACAGGRGVGVRWSEMGEVECERRTGDEGRKSLIGLSFGWLIGRCHTVLLTRGYWCVVHGVDCAWWWDEPPTCPSLMLATLWTSAATCAPSASTSAVLAGCAAIPSSVRPAPGAPAVACWAGVRPRGVDTIATMYFNRARLPSTGSKFNGFFWKPPKNHAVSSTLPA